MSAAGGTGGDGTRPTRTSSVRRSAPRTSAIPRSRTRDDTASTASTTRGIRRGGDGSLADLTHTISRERLLFRGQGKRLVFRGVAAVILVAIIGALFVIPVSSYLRQQDAIAVKKAEFAALEQVNAELADEVTRLQTPDGIAEAAREEIGYVRKGEIRLTVLPSPAAPLTLPGGWPYGAIAGAVAVQQAEADAAVAATSSTTPP